MKQSKRNNLINLDDWYNVEQATERLSANSEREVSKDYPRTLARYGLVQSLKVSSRSILYYKPDIDAYVVKDTAGRRPKEPRTKPEAKRCENCGRESDDLTECEDCKKLCCELCIAGQYRGFSYWDGDVDYVMQCAECAGMPALAV